MNNNTKFLFKTAVTQLHAEKMTTEHPSYNDRVWRRYQAIDEAQKFVAAMVAQTYTQKHSGETLATGFRK